MDENLYSRQIYTIGKESQLKILESSILLLCNNINNITLEIIKNLCLTGFKNIIIEDPTKNVPINEQDILENYYINNNHINKNKTIIINKLQNLNKNCNIIYEESINFDDIITQYHINCIITVNLTMDQNTCINNKIHNKINFIVCNNDYIFVDFGENYYINDINGVEYKQKTINKITIINKDSIIINTHEKHELNNHLSIQLSNNNNTHEIEMIDQYTIKIPFFDDFINEDHLYLVAKNKSLILNFDSFEHFISKNIIKSHQIINNNNNNNSNYNHNNSSIIAAIVAQEIIKGVSKKLTPIHQILHIKDIINKNYTNIINNNKCIFVVGAGAIGCELLKNLIMVGFKNIIIADMDHIEKSNLSRHFLFNDENIGQSKSEIAAKKIKEMRPDVTIKVMT